MMHLPPFPALWALVLTAAGSWDAAAQAVFSGRLEGPRVAGLPAKFPYAGVLCVASPGGSGVETRAFRTWETEPAGWYRINGPAGDYTLVFTGPAHFIRPIVRTRLYLRPGEAVDRWDWTPSFDFHMHDESAWDPARATDYYQTFVARGTSVTQVGFRLAHDGMDGFGPQGQNLLVSVHRRNDGAPDQWPQVGPTVPVLGVDSGGGKNYVWSAGWNSGEVPLERGETYAVHLCAEIPGNTFQAFWRSDSDEAADAYRLGQGSNGWQRHDLWLTVATDHDGLVIPYNKRVHRQFGEFAGFARRWSQTYRARGRGLAAVVLYAATGGTQPPLNRQRATVRVRRGGPGGHVVGIEKIAIGNGNYTGDASWGVLCCAFAPGEVPLTPGDTYAVEFESLENHETLDGFVNIKGQVSDRRPGFNPYRKCAPDTCPAGTAFKAGAEAMPFDLDLQILEYEHAREHTPRAPDAPTDPGNLLVNGDMQAGQLANAQGAPDGWMPFATDPGTTHAWVADGPDPTNRFARVIGGGFNRKTVDGGFVQRVGGLSRRETYILTGRVRSSWALDREHQCFVGFDPTGQDSDPRAASIEWTALPGLHGHFVSYASRPIRPLTDSVSVWLRGRTTLTVDYPFKADFDAFGLRRVRTEPPAADPGP
ncbi:MAG: hypothetical protein JXQ71_05765 [Verrucomicrobia bacterium]|nr:hypothetical protein [Verrucomicrobiota bacterium]